MRRRVLSLVPAIVSLGLCSAHAALAAPPDPLGPLINRVDVYLRDQDPEQVLLDPRFLVNPSEMTRLSVVSQLLGYLELNARSPRPEYRRRIAVLADFLVDRFDAVSARTAFDGMLGYALLCAHDVTGDDRYLGPAGLIAARCMRTRDMENTLNWGLMAGLTLAKFYEKTGIGAVGEKLRLILDSVDAYQNADGSFPHYCPASRDVGYSAWMGMELILIRRHVAYPPIDRMLERVHGFLRGRVGPDGRTVYQEPCPDYPGCWTYYYSSGSGCARLDYDTRAWSNELAHSAVVFDHFKDDKYGTLMAFLFRLEDRGAFPDKWDFHPSPGDPIYLWGSSPRSLIRTSVIFWCLASIQAARDGKGPARRARALGGGPARGSREPLGLAEEGLRLASAYAAAAAVDARGPARRPAATAPTSRSAEPSSAAGPSPAPRPHLDPPCPNPATSPVALGFTLGRRGPATLTVHDARGRLVRKLLSAPLDAGRHHASWDLTDVRGARCPPGVYLACLRADGQVLRRRIALLR